MPLVVGVAIILVDKFDVSLTGLMETFDKTSSMFIFDVNERGTSGLPAFIIVIREGELGIEMILGDKFVDLKKERKEFERIRLTGEVKELTFARLLMQAGDVVVAVLESELVELYMRLPFPDASFDGSKIETET